MEVYLHYPMRLHGLVLISTRDNFNFTSEEVIMYLINGDYLYCPLRKTLGKTDSDIRVYIHS